MKKTAVDHWDSYYYGTGTAGDLMISMFAESLGMLNWSLDRSQYYGAYTTRTRDEEVRTGLVAESYEWPDLQTVIFHLHKGIKWQDKPPVNGREFTADDVVWHFSRQRGLGSFKTGSPYRVHAQYAPLQSVTATDKYTVVFKYSAPSIDMLDNLLDDFGYMNMMAREVVEKFGNAEDWHNAVGTGPYMVKDYVSGSSVLFAKNQNYWGNFEWYPDMKLPFADQVRFFIIPDDATAYAALRTGKLDSVGEYQEPVGWEQAASLAKTSPELVIGYRPSSGHGIGLRADTKPFSDIRVRRALQMAIDLNTIAKTKYGGLVDGTPYAKMGPVQKPGWYTPYSEWPQALKDSYAYNPTGAKALLAEAGYPNGFKTNVIVDTGVADMDLAQIAKAYFLAIGVDMEIRPMDSTSWNTLVRGGRHEQMCYGGGTDPGGINPPRIQLNQYYSTHPTNYTKNNDPTYDKMVDSFFAATTREDQRKIARAADDYGLQQQWVVVLVGSTVDSFIHQPYLKGWSGEMYRTGYQYARFWIDQKLKTSMGR